MPTGPWCSELFVVGGDVWRKGCRLSSHTFCGQSCLSMWYFCEFRGHFVMFLHLKFRSTGH